MRALALYSGGLDSSLVIALMQQAGVEVVPIHFTSPFGGSHGKQAHLDKAAVIARQFQLELHQFPIDDELVALVKNPHFGHGQHFNPCIDCHLLMLRKTKELLPRLNADFVITGEVLGQRPMSQHRQALEVIARKSGLEGLLVRPLSAAILEPTVPAEKGWVAPEFLLDINGRGRKRQMEMAKTLHITEYAQPAGGCLLTDPQYSHKLKELIDAQMLTVPNCYWIQAGRFFNLAADCKLMVARNESECNDLEERLQSGDYWLDAPGKRGPVGVIRGNATQVLIELAASIVTFYYRTTELIQLEMIHIPGKDKQSITVPAIQEEDLRRILIA